MARVARIAIVGGGIAGLAAAYQCELQRRAGAPLDWHLYEASPRLGGTVSTTRLVSAEGEYILEDGPDGWLTEKPWAAELINELGLEAELIPCHEAQRRTLLWLNGALVPMPARMRLMVPENLDALHELENSPLFSAEAIAAYKAEVDRAEELRRAVPQGDESVASFVRRHFGEEVLRKVASPLLSGVFGGDVERLSARAVMPRFVALEHEAGSLIAGLEARARMRGDRPPQPTFTSLRRGVGSLPEALVAALPPERLHRNHSVAQLTRSTREPWLLRLAGSGLNACIAGLVPFDHVLLATPADATRQLLANLDEAAAGLIPTQASSALLVTLCWPADTAQTFALPQGFGFLAPPGTIAAQPQLLAATFAGQKYPHRAPAGAHIIRAFFGDGGAAALAHASAAEAAQVAFHALQAILGPLPPPQPELTTVRHWPRSLPQYEVGHLERMDSLSARVNALGNLHLLGNSYRGVGVPDLIREARAAARSLTEKAQTLTEKA